MTLDPRCDRPYRHHRHTFVDDNDVDHDCPGNQPASSLPELLAERPALVDVGVVPQVLALEVMSA
jgi:hypothetical protein